MYPAGQVLWHVSCGLSKKVLYGQKYVCKERSSTVRVIPLPALMVSWLSGRNVKAVLKELPVSEKWDKPNMTLKGSSYLNAIDLEDAKEKLLISMLAKVALFTTAGSKLNQPNLTVST